MRKKLNDSLDRQLTLARDLIKLAQRQSVADVGSYVKEKFGPNLRLNELASSVFNLRSAYVPANKKKKEGFFLLLDKYVESKEKKVKPSTLGVFRQMGMHMEAFEVFRKEKITFACLDYSFYVSPSIYIEDMNGVF